MRCLFQDEFGKRCEYEEPEVEQYCWRHDPEKPAILFIRQYDGHDIMEMCEGLSKEAAARYVDAGVALYFADDQVNKWHNEYLITNLKLTLARMMRSWREQGNMDTLRSSFATRKNKKRALETVNSNGSLTIEEKEYFTSVIRDMQDADFGQTSSTDTNLDDKFRENPDRGKAT